VAALALEGRSWEEEEARPLRAPVPGRAAELLRRLLGGRDAYASLAEFSAALQAVMAHPVEVTRPRRGAHLALNALALGPGLAWMLCAGPLLVLLLAMNSVFAELLQPEPVQRELERQIARDIAGLVTAAGPWHRLAVAAELSANAGARDSLRQAIIEAPRQREVLFRSWSWVARHNIARMEAEGRQEFEESPDKPDEKALWERGGVRLSARQRAQALAQSLAAPQVGATNLLAEPLLLVGLVAGWPLLWALWAGVTRGGLGLRLVGARLVQADGRRAARWRCAWRALVVWAPMVALLLASLFLDLWRIARAAPDGPAGADYLAWLAWLTWWLALSLLPLYVWVGLRWPRRGPHDALAGTHPVPR
jgi:hypothetical protein